MLFSSFVFLLAFLPVSLAVYHLLRVGGRPQAAKVFLVAASLFFYGWWKLDYVPLIVISIAVNYALSLFLEKKPDRAKLFLVLGLVFNLGLLGYYKYAGFLVEVGSELTGLDFAIRKVALPLAISFFTFQQIAYLIECYKDRKAADSLTDYCLFVLFFPHLIAGPITHHKEMLPQFKRAGIGKLDISYFKVGAALLVLGLAKKAVVADTLATICNPIFHAADQGHAVSAAAAWLGSLTYAFQLYFDFSGYSDMAVGLGLLFGIRLPVNFASPYKATSIVEFWRRWHISLSRFLRNYLYIPLGGNRAGPVRRYGNLLVTMALGGLWHGAGWNFLAWGVLHGLYLVINHLWRTVFGAAKGRVGAVISWAITFLAVLVAWVPFKATTWEGALRVLGGMANPLAAGDPAHILATPAIAWAACVAAALAAFLAPNALEMARYPHSVPHAEEVEIAPLKPVHWRLGVLPQAIALGVIAAFAIAKLPDPGVFLYFNF